MSNFFVEQATLFCFGWKSWTEIWQQSLALSTKGLHNKRRQIDTPHRRSTLRYQFKHFHHEVPPCLACGLVCDPFVCWVWLGPRMWQRRAELLLPALWKWPLRPSKRLLPVLQL